MSLWLAIYFASIIVSGGLYYTGGSALNPQRTKAFCVASLSLMQVELERQTARPSAVSTIDYGRFWAARARQV